MNFELTSPLREVEVIAVGRGIRELRRLNRLYGRARWRKLKGVGRIRLNNDISLTAELHWYEAHGIGRKEMKIKRFLE